MTAIMASGSSSSESSSGASPPCPPLPKVVDSKGNPTPIDAVPYDPRFPSMNQTRHCYQHYLDYHRCRKVKGEEYEPCEWFHKAYRIMCPKIWHEKWDEQRENGTFPGRI